MNTKCRCIPGKYVCGDCKAKRRQKIWDSLTPAQKAYDRYVCRQSDESPWIVDGENYDFDADEPGMEDVEVTP